MEVQVQIISIVVTILLAFSGYLISRRSELELSKRKERLELVDRMINEFYGPLYITTKAGERAQKALKQKLGTKDIFPDNQLPNERALSEWRYWVKSVFIPLNQIREDVILEKAHLIRETEVPNCLLEFIAHASAYKAMAEKWNNGDLSDYLPILGFPKELEAYAEKSYVELKTEQAKLIGLLRK